MLQKFIRMDEHFKYLLNKTLLQGCLVSAFETRHHLIKFDTTKLSLLNFDKRIVGVVIILDSYVSWPDWALLVIEYSYPNKRKQLFHENFLCWKCI